MMSSGAKKKSPSRPEIKMTRSAQLKQQPTQSSRTRSGSLPGVSPAPLKKPLDPDRRESLTHRKALPSPGLIRKTKSLNPGGKSLAYVGKQSMDSLDSVGAISRDALHSSSTSLHSVGQASTGSGGSSSSKVRKVAMSVTQRLYQCRDPNPELRNYLRKRDRNLPKFLRKSKASPPVSEPSSKKKLAVIPDVDMVDSRDKVYDWLHRKVHSQEDVTEQKGFMIDLSEKAILKERRTSDPKGDVAAKFIEEYHSEIEDGYNRDGVRFVKDYFQKVLVWLTPKVDAFLSARNLGRDNMFATNEERYCQEMRSSLASPRRKVKHVNFMDMMDIPTGEVTLDTFNASRYEEEEMEKPIQVAHVGIQTDRIKADASTNTPQPRMVNKLIETERRSSTGTSTDDLSKFIRESQSTPIPIIHMEEGVSFEYLNESLLTPRASLVDEEMESSSAYGSLSSNSLRALVDKVNDLQKEISSKFFMDDGRKISKAAMTDDETSQVHQELNRLANERIEILELLVLNIGNLPSSLTVELLEAKLNYSIGQTDQLLAVLEESWDLESSLEPSHSKQMVNITKEIINQSRIELAESRKTIKICLEEVKHVLAGGHSRKRALSAEILKMKRRAEIEAFKLERMWEQLFHERTKKRQCHLRSSLSTVGKPLPRTSTNDSAVGAMQSYIHYLSDLRQRSVLAASEEELDDLRLQTTYMNLPNHADYHHDNSWDTSSITSTSSSYLSPRIHKDHLIEQRRQIIAETDRERSRSTSRMSSDVGASSPSYTSSTSYTSKPSYTSCTSYTSKPSYTSSTSYSSSYWPRSSRYTSSPGSGLDRFSKYTSSTNSAVPGRSGTYKSSYQSSSFRLSHPDLLSPARPSYRAAGRYSVK